ncbi:MAG TPA: hypothetical protein VER33_17020 [Polyangiaceae bacterium]|nr:hypothetical protein [Polyangiaceae bacterium]
MSSTKYPRCLGARRVALVLLVLAVPLGCSSGRTETVGTWDVSEIVNPPVSQPAALSNGAPSSEDALGSGAEAGAGAQSEDD